MTQVIETPDQIKNWVFDKRRTGETVGFIPTMGAYHDGHRALMKKAVDENDATVVSLFVNPTQFPSEQRAGDYPRDFDRDLNVLEEESIDAVFHPDPSDIYPDRDATDVLIQNKVTETYEGELKPRFFPGVAKVVAKLFNLVPADRAYFGEKDLQQLLMIRRMIRDLHFPHQLRTVPVVRDDDGVAFSSRNRRLEEDDWQTARSMRTIMESVKDRAGELERSDLDRFREEMKEAGLDLDYLDVVAYPSFDRVAPGNPLAVLIVAGTVGEVRLKDNLPIHADTIGELEEIVDE